MKRSWKRPGLVAVAVALTAGCGGAPPAPEITLVVAWQALIKVDPRLSWEDPLGSLRPILQSADVAFTNFEMAVKSEVDACTVPDEYVVVRGEPRLTPEQRPGNSGAPHAVDASVMEFLSALGFDPMSIANNHAWDLGDCGVAATRTAADASGVTYAGAGPNLAAATAPAYLTVDGVRIGLVAATTSHDERDAIHHAVNGVWTGRQDDWDRNLEAVREAAARADFVIYYQHFQIDLDEFDSIDLTPLVVHFLRESQAHCQSFDERRLDGLRRWRAVAQRAVGSYGVVLPPPPFDQDLRFGQGVEDLTVEQLVA